LVYWADKQGNRDLCKLWFIIIIIII